jgi:hypothetical protein
LVVDVLVVDVLEVDVLEVDQMGRPNNYYIVKINRFCLNNVPLKLKKFVRELLFE